MLTYIFKSHKCFPDDLRQNALDLKDRVLKDKQ